MHTLDRRTANLALVSTLLGLATASPAWGAAGAADRAARNLADFDFVVEKIRLNYAGYDTKVTDATRAKLDALTARLRGQAATASDAELQALLEEWIGFFHDGHTRIYANADSGVTPTKAGPTAAPVRRAWTETSLRQRLESLGSGRDPIEGVWRINGDRYRVGVVRTKVAGQFEGLVLTTTADGWAPGELKADIGRTSNGTFKVQYRMGNHAVRDLEGRLGADGAALVFGEDLGAWAREWPAVADPDKAMKLFPAGELFLRRLSARTLWLRLPDFDDSRAEPLRAALAAEAKALETTPNLVIDLRLNGGGSDYVYAPLRPLLYSRPIYGIGVEMRATADNLALRRAIAAQISDPEARASLEAQNRLLEQNLGRYFCPDPRPFGVDRFDQVLPAPKRVAILIDGAASSGEQFLLEARQSRKVTLFGQRNSAGVLDFANVVGMATPSGRHMLRWATSRSLRLPDDPVDPDGIAPDVRIPAEIEDPVSYAQAWLERQVD